MRNHQYKRIIPLIHSTTRLLCLFFFLWMKNDVQIVPQHQHHSTSPSDGNYYYHHHHVVMASSTPTSTSSSIPQLSNRIKKHKLIIATQNHPIDFDDSSSIHNTDHDQQRTSATTSTTAIPISPTISSLSSQLDHRSSMSIDSTPQQIQRNGQRNIMSYSRVLFKHWKEQLQHVTRRLLRQSKQQQPPKQNDYNDEDLTSDSINTTIKQDEEDHPKQQTRQVGQRHPSISFFRRSRILPYQLQPSSSHKNPNNDRAAIPSTSISSNIGPVAMDQNNFPHPIVHNNNNNQNNNYVKVHRNSYTNNNNIVSSFVRYIVSIFRNILYENNNADNNNSHIQQYVQYGIRYSIIIYIIFHCSKMLLSMIEEINISLSNILSLPIDYSDQINHNNNIDGGDSSSSGSMTNVPAYRNYHKQIQEIIQYLQHNMDNQQQQSPSTIVTETGRNHTNSNTNTNYLNMEEQNLQLLHKIRTSTIYQSIYTLAQLLHSAGIPYVTTATTTTTTTTDSNYTNNTNTDNTIWSSSVESLLTELTHNEIALLQQCLYILPSTTTTYTNNNVFDNTIRRNMIGLESIYEQIVDTIQTNIVVPPSKQNNPNNTTTTTIHNPFASLFHDSVTSSSSSSSSNNNNNVGILLYGPPGCGKTNLIRTLVRTLQIPCLIVTPSILLRKYVGETNLHIRTIFHMIQNKLLPCIVCIDELDGLFRERQHETEHEVNRELKTEFLQWMDGMMTATTSSNNNINSNRKSYPIIMIGATNRPFDVDAAILRRLSHTYYIGLPNHQQRYELLTQFIQSIPHTISKSQLAQLISVTSGYTPSDLRQLLQVAAISGPMKRKEGGSNGMKSDPNENSENQLNINDLLNAMSVIGPTPLSSNYQQQMQTFRNQRNALSTKNNRDVSLFMNDNEDTDDTQDTSISNRPFALSFLDRNENDENFDTPNNKWETIFGNFYSLGTLEMDQSTLDLFVQYINTVLEDNSNDSHNDNVDDNNDQ